MKQKKMATWRDNLPKFLILIDYLPNFKQQLLSVVPIHKSCETPICQLCQAKL